VFTCLLCIGPDSQPGAELDLRCKPFQRFVSINGLCAGGEVAAAAVATMVAVAAALNQLAEEGFVS
jgi:hypothetical protein